MKKTVIFSLFLLSIGASVQAQDTTYDWTGGLPGYSGQIVLDSPSSVGGSLSDVVSLTITDPQGTFTLDPATVFYFQTPFTWNASQITSMWIDWFVPGGLAGVAENYANSGQNFIESVVDGPGQGDFSGSWVAADPVPDAGSTAGFLSAALGGLALFRCCRSKILANGPMEKITRVIS